MTENYKVRNFEQDYEKIDAALAHEGKRKHKKGKKKSGLKIALLSLAVLCLIVATSGYAWGVNYFSDRFFFNTQVNGVDFSRQTTHDARTYVESASSNFYLAIHTPSGEIEHIYAHEINLTFTADAVIDDMLAAQNPFTWPFSYFNNQSTDASFSMDFDAQLLDERILQLSFVENGTTEPVSASVVMDGAYAVVVPHAYGNRVRIDVLGEKINDYISGLRTTFHADTPALFYQPELTAESAVIVETLAAANHYLNTEITFLVGDEIVLDRTEISEWVSIDEDFTVRLDESGIEAWFNDFVPRVNSHGTTRRLTTPRGREVEVTGGYYGWRVSRELEFPQLLSDIREGVVVAREPIFFQRAESFDEQDWGETFIQVDMGEQHMWFILEGEVIFEAPVITGLPEGNRATPEGVYFILDTLSPTVLIGATDPVTGEPIYETPVSYWMRTTWNGHGFHDAIWQTQGFGGTLYRTHGSHGCTNLSLEDARTLYHLIQTHWPVMMPVVVHY